MTSRASRTTPATFHAAPPGARGLGPFYLFARTRGIAPASLMGPVQALAVQIGLGAVRVTPMDVFYRGDRESYASSS